MCFLGVNQVQFAKYGYRSTSLAVNQGGSVSAVLVV